ncbi:MAG TPA: hypothetical protein VGQ76_24240 [Thermoanaerobaculia bacterium]|nr:hypothetical protein [Thermoanaerobaculia bacterium]
MEFVLRILFSGLIVFIPSEDRQEVTVLLLNVNHAHHVSDNTTIEQHKPILVTRGGGCVGDCPTDDTAIAEWLYPDKTTAAALASLAVAATGGAAWDLTGSELSLCKGNVNDPDLPAFVFYDDARGSVNGVPTIIPASSTEREDINWLADLKKLCPTCSIDPDVLAAQPPAGVVAARFTLRTGKLFTYSIARIGSDVTPVHFKRLDGTGSASSYSQAVASWVGADITVSGESIELVETKFNGDPGRSMKISPDDGKVEIALINLPPLMPPTTEMPATPEVGKHFEMFYEVAQTPPAPAARLVPLAGAAPGAPSYPEVDWHSIHPDEELWSDLLNQLRLNIGRTAYEQILCPPSQNPRP